MPLPALREAWRGVRGPRDWIALALLVVFVVAAALTRDGSRATALAVNRLRTASATWCSTAATAGRGSASTSSGATCRWRRSRRTLQQAVIAVGGSPLLLSPGHRSRSASARAMLRNVREPGTVEGGSTLTQQLARTLFLSNARTFGRKVEGSGDRAAPRAAADARTQILELYLNRVYLSAGVYGVEAMSSSLFGKHGQRPDARRGGARGRAHPARRRRCRRGRTTMARCARSDIVLPRMREQGFITDASRATRRGARGCASSRIRRLAMPARGYAKEYLRQQFREPVRGRSAAGLAGAHDVAARRAGRRRAGGGRRPARGSAAGPAGGARRARPATGRRAGHGRRTDFRDDAVQPRRAQPPAARLRVQAVRLRGRARRAASRRSPCSTAWTRRARRDREEWTPRNAKGDDRRR